MVIPLVQITGDSSQKESPRLKCVVVRRKPTSIGETPYTPLKPKVFLGGFHVFFLQKVFRQVSDPFIPQLEVT